MMCSRVLNPRPLQIVLPPTGKFYLWFSPASCSVGVVYLIGYFLFQKLIFVSNGLDLDFTIHLFYNIVETILIIQIVLMFGAFWFCFLHVFQGALFSISLILYHCKFINAVILDGIDDEA